MFNYVNGEEGYFYGLFIAWTLKVFSHDTFSVSKSEIGKMHSPLSQFWAGYIFIRTFFTHRRGSSYLNSLTSLLLIYFHGRGPSSFVYSWADDMEQVTNSFYLSALEARVVTRWDVHKYARQAYDMGVRFIGGCCGFEPYHIRAIAEEVGKIVFY